MTQRTHSSLCPATFNDQAAGACECGGRVRDYAVAACPHLFGVQVGDEIHCENCRGFIRYA